MFHYDLRRRVYRFLTWEMGRADILFLLHDDRGVSGVICELEVAEENEVAEA